MASEPFRVVLIGESTSGKSSVGPQLALALGLALADVDQIVARRQSQSTEDLFASYGVEGYQERNEQALREVFADEALCRAVIVTGAVTPLSPANRRQLIQASDVLVHLHASPGAIHARLTQSMARGAPHSAHSMVIGFPDRHLQHLHEIRSPYYRMAEVRIDTDDKSIADVVEETRHAVNDQLNRLRPANLPSQVPFDAVYEAAGGKLHYPKSSRTLRELVRRIGRNGLRVLDLGCGDGRNALMMATYGCDIEAVDISSVAVAKLLKFSREKGLRNLRVRRGDVSSCALPRAAYDVIVAGTILDHIPRSATTEVSKRMVESLRPGGYLYATAFTTDDPGACEKGSHPMVSDDAYLVNHYMEPGELRSMFDGLDVLDYREADEMDTSHGAPHMHGKAKLLARRLPDT